MRRGISYSQDISVLIETTTWRQTVPEINAHPILTCRELHGSMVAVSESSRIATRAANRAQGCDWSQQRFSCEFLLLLADHVTREETFFFVQSQ